PADRRSATCARRQAPPRAAVADRDAGGSVAVPPARRDWSGPHRGYRRSPSRHAVPLRQGRPQQPFFWLRQFERVAQYLVFQGLLAEQPLQLAHLVLQGSVFGGGHYLLAGPDRRQRALGVQPPPSEH